MKKLVFPMAALATLFIAIMASTLVVQPVQATTTTIFSDGFESGSFANWSGMARYCWMCTAYITGTSYYSGYHSGRFGTGTSMMMGMMYNNYDYSAVYRNIAAISDVHVSGAFRVARSGLSSDSSSFSMMLLSASGNNVAYAGWRMMGGVAKWYLLIRSGTGTVSAYSTSSPMMNTWYNLELHWRNGATSGLGELYVNGVRVATISGRNTSAYGNVNQVRIGIPRAMSSSGTVLYADSIRIFRTS